MKIPSKIKFVDKNLLRAFEKLKNSKGDERKLHEFLVRAFKDIENDAFCGIQVPKGLIPKNYIKKYNVKNVWKYNLPDAWRLFYSIESDGIIVLSIILEWLRHKEYERRFKY